jgi:hypothetical protein
MRDSFEKMLDLLDGPDKWIQGMDAIGTFIKPFTGRRSFGRVIPFVHGIDEQDE